MLASFALRMYVLLKKEKNSLQSRFTDKFR